MTRTGKATAAVFAKTVQVIPIAAENAAESASKKPVKSAVSIYSAIKHPDRRDGLHYINAFCGRKQGEQEGNAL